MIVIAPDKFKGCLTAAQAAEAIVAGLRGADSTIQLDICPMADGGEGTVDALVAATAGRFQTRTVTGPRSDMRVPARWGILGDGTTAVIEMASASGLALLEKGDYDPMLTTTYGTGELLMAAAGMGATKIILGIGGSATLDGGIGAAQACGLPVILEDGQLIPLGEPLVGGDLPRVRLVKRGRGSAIGRVPIVVACDVDNPLCGERGAARVFGPQKGATSVQVEFFDRALAELARRLGKEDLAAAPGSGAAGGLGFGMQAFFAATLRPGIDIVIEATKLEDRLTGAELCITGEGRFDRQSLSGKTTIGVARLCKKLGVPCVVLAGSIGPDVAEAHEMGVSEYFSIGDETMSLEESMRRAAELLSAASANLIRLRAER